MPMNSATAQQEHNVHPVYRPDIDGLRAIAILSVVLFHAFPILRGGFVGVDIFFVISGFLISSIIFRSLQRGDFSFAEFYAHRVKRIFPALIVVLAVTYLIGWFALLPDEFKQLGKHMAAGAGFVQNIALWSEIGYFDAGSELKPLMHLWSLAVEEQFYLTYPLLIWVIWRLRWNVLTALALLGLLSFGLNVLGITQDVVSTFFLPQTRFWELFAGALLAYFQLFKRAQWRDWLRQRLLPAVLFRQSPLSDQYERVLKTLLSALGLMLILWSVTSIQQDFAFPGWWALVPVAGTFLLILAGPEAWVNQKILANKAMVFVGLISYSLYLWHWPLLTLTRIVKSEIPSAEIRLMVVMISFLLAWLTYRFIERPIRFGRKAWIKTAALSALLALVGYVGYVTYERDGLAFRVPREIREIATASFAYTPYPTKRTCRSDGYQTLCTEDERPSIMLWGDSHANSLYAGFNSLQKTYALGVGQSTGCGNPPYMNLGNYTDAAWCDTAAKRLSVNEATVKAISATRPEVIILHARWAYDHYRTSEAETIKKLKETIARILGVSPASKIVVLGPVPNWRSPLGHQMIMYWKNTFPHTLPPRYMRVGLVTEIERWDDFLAMEVPKLGVTYLSAYKVLCNDDGCLTRVGPNPSELTATDSAHLSPAGAAYLATRLLPSLFDLLENRPRARLAR